MSESAPELGGYEVLAQLKSGGMATLYLGQRSGPAGFKRHVAIKVLKNHLANNRKFIEMFIDEARIAARIAHPNVVHIEELGERDGRYFLVMEYVHGSALSEMLMALAQSGRRLKPKTAVALMMRSAAGLHAAHETRDDSGQLLDVIHRDVSPQNILLGARGQVKIIDFGIAKARNRLHVTDAGAGLKGKLRYMAPEQLAGTAVNRRADIYSLGVVLWEMLAMRRLFHGQSDPEVIQRIMKGDMPPPGAFADVPFGVDGVVLEALSRDPSRRPETARAFRQRLKEALPEAASVEEGELAAMLWAVLGKELYARARELPGVGATLNNMELDVAPERALEMLTEPLEQVMQDAETVVAMSAASSHDDDDAATQVRDSSSGGDSRPQFAKPKLGAGGPLASGSLPPGLVSAAALSSQAPPAQSGTSTLKLILIVVIAIVVGAAAAVGVLTMIRNNDAPPAISGP